MIKIQITFLILIFGFTSFSQTDSLNLTYKKRVLESTEINILSSYYQQDGDNAAVSGGIGTEELTDATGTIIVSIPINEDDVVSIEGGVSSYTSASSSNVNPFDNREQQANAFIASSGASRQDVWSSVNASYSHSSEDRNKIVGISASFANEYDYQSIGGSVNYARLFNQKNTEVSLKASAYLDNWKAIYPIELRGQGSNDDDDDDDDINFQNITGANYSPNFSPLSQNNRNSYSVGFGLSQILSKNIQGSLALDITQQEGLLSTPFQRVYFSDIGDSFLDDFHLADDIERLPDSRLKIAVGGRLNTYINENITVRNYYRYYQDDWGISSHTANIEVPVKINDGKFVLYPSYRYYSQTEADYFKPYNEHLSTDSFYTSDFDLSTYNANQFGFGTSYNKLLGKSTNSFFGLKSIDAKYYYYDRSNTLSSGIATIGFKFNINK